MASTGATFLTQSKYGIWYYQRWMPLYFRKANPDLSKLFRVSLHTQNKPKALRQSRALSVKIDKMALQFFETPQDFGRAMELLYKSAKAQDENPNFPAYEEAFFSKIEDFDEYLLSKAERFQERYKEDIDKIQDEVSFLREALLNSKHVANEQDARKLAQEIANKIHPPLSDEENPTLEKLFQIWQTAKQGAMVESSYDGFYRMINLFIRIITDYNGEPVRINELKPLHIRKYHENFNKIPVRATTGNRTISELIQMNGERVSSKTKKDTYSNIGSFLTFISSKGFPLDTQIEKVLIKGDESEANNKQKIQRPPFTDEELKKIFNSDRYINTGKFKSSGMFWVPLIALFTGARMSEILQLEKQDIKKVGKIWTMSITNADNQSEDKDKRVKAKGSIREIPIHKQLLDLKFIDYLKSVDGRLFPDEPRNNKGKFDAFQKRFATYIKQVKVLPTHELEQKTFHNFRHTVRTKLAEIRTTGKASERFDEGLIDGILGHSSKDRSEGQKSYNHTQYIEAKSNALGRLEYNCIDFEKLIQWNNCEFWRKRFRK